MFASIGAAVLALSAAATAAPTLVPRQSMAAPLNITYSSGRNASLPNILILATGGTIAGSSADSSDATHYQSGQIGVAALTQAVPMLLNIANIDGIQVANVGSGDVSDATVLSMSQIANTVLCGPQANYTGLVVTSGTDTLEETAFALDITLMCDSPIVIVGAMRPSTAISADGPANLLEAVTVAADPNARGRGAMIVLNDRIGQAWYTEKTNANVLDTFKAIEQGYVGGFLSYKPFYWYPPAQPSFKHVFNSMNVTTVPPVAIIYCSESYDAMLIQHAIQDGNQGIIMASTGAGDVAAFSEPYITNATNAGIPVVVSTKINNGAVVPSPGFPINSGYLNPVKSKIQLQYAIASGFSMNDTKTLFEGVLTSYVGA